jgi:hypothetical protein
LSALAVNQGDSANHGWDLVVIRQHSGARRGQIASFWSFIYDASWPFCLPVHFVIQMSFALESKLRLQTSKYQMQHQGCPLADGDRWCKCACTCLCMCECTHASLCTRVYACHRVLACKCVSVSACSSVHVCVRVCVRVCACVHVCMSVFTCTHVYALRSELVAQSDVHWWRVK